MLHPVKNVAVQELVMSDPKPREKQKINDPNQAHLMVDTLFLC
jgi:hypothetical protein